MDPLRLRLIVPGLGLLGLDLAAVGAPLLALFQPRLDVLAALAWAATPATLAALAVWAWVVARWLRPVYQARALRRAGQAPRADLDAAARDAIVRLPQRALTLRASLWTLAGLATDAALAARGRIDWEDALLIASVFSLNTLCPTVFRAFWYEWLLEGPLADLGARADSLELLRARLLGRVRRRSLAVGAIGVTGIAMFIHFFIPVTLEQYRGLQTWFPLTILALLGAWLPAFRASARPLRDYFAAESPSDALAARAYRAADSLPYRLAAVMVTFWLVAEALLLVEATFFFGFEAERAVLCAATIFFVMLGVAIYGSILHRQSLRPLLAEIARRRRHLVRETRPFLSLRGKMLAGFGGLALFLCAFTLFWSFVQYRRLAMAFIEKQAERELGHLADGLREGAASDAAAVAAYLRARVGDEETVAYYLAPDGEVVGVAAGGAAPPLPPGMVESIRRRRQGPLDATAIRMQGAFAPIGSGRPDGTLVVLLPGYRGRGPGLERNLRVLLVFFVLLFVTASGIVGLVARDLARPVKALARRAEAMGRGDLASAVPVGPEPDELGRLGHAFEEMRTALNEKIAALEDLQASLERKVAERTRDLERSNRELRDALAALREAQAKLVASEKMAVVGQLLAGVTHEINNPVNAIVNTVEPLEDATRRLLARAGQGPGAAAGDRRELEEMFRVIKSGVDRAKRIVGALRNYARGDSEDLQEFDVHRGLDEALELLRHDLRHGVTVERRYGDVGRLRAYPGQLAQVFLNLLGNAAQSLAGREDGRIEIETRPSDGAVEVVVRDNGPGIPDDVVPRIFDPFFTTKPVGQGTGLGLAICQQIVQRHGGTIRVETRPGGGAAFTVVLPLARPEPAT